ncbi:MAG: C13 family peptidase [Casimicrobiaceae bacterium]
MRHFLIDLRQNLLAGVRLALLRPVRRLDFRVSPSQFVAVALVAAMCGSLVDLAVLHGAANFNGAGIGGHVRDTALLLLLAWIVSAWLRIPGVLAALPVVFFASGLVPDLTFAAILAAIAASGIVGNWYVLALWWILLAWTFVVAWRSVSVVLQGEGNFTWVRRGVAVAIVFGGTIGVALLYPSPRLWDERALQANVDPLAQKTPKVQSEEVLSAQPRLLFEALTGLEEREAGTTNTYFVGFAGDSTQDVFRNDMEAAQDVVDERIGTQGRSVVLINSPRTVLESPLASVTNLRAALGTVGRLIDVDEDIAFLYLSSHGSPDHQLYVNFPPLDLQQLTPTALSRLLQESGIKWKVVVVSACYSGGYIEPLKDQNTIVITSARADRTSFGCGNDSEFTYFGRAYFQEALKVTDSYIDAFELARAAISRREKDDGYTPSEPQMFVGDEIRKKLGAKRKPATLAAADRP